MEPEFRFFASHLKVDIEKASEYFDMELISLQYDTNLNQTTSETNCSCSGSNVGLEVPTLNQVLANHRLGTTRC
jgi:hypothetical protein